MRISISTMSKSFNLSDEALRFYERKGLLNPARLNDRGYRVFERMDIQRVGNIKRLKNQGFQLEEIRHIYDGISQPDMIELMAQKWRELDWQMHYNELICARMSECMSLVRRWERVGARPVMMREKPFFMRLYPSIEALWEKVNDSETLKKLFCHLPLSSFTTVIPRQALHDARLMVNPPKGVLIGAEAAALLAIDTTHDFRRIDASTAVSCVLELENGQFEMDEIVQPLLTFLAEKNLRPADDLFTHQIMNFTDENKVHRHYTELVLPVEEA